MRKQTRRRSLNCEPLEARRVLAADILTVADVDMNQDGHVAPADVLHVVNNLGTNDSGADIDGDGVVAPLDAMGVMNFMNELGSNSDANLGDSGSDDGDIQHALMDDHVNEIGDDASELSRGGRGTGELEMEGDIDVFQFSMGEDGDVSIRGFTRVDGGIDIVVLDANGEAVATNDDGEYDLAAGDYYIAVSATDGASTGSYAFRVRGIQDGGDGPSDDHVNEIGDDATVIRIGDRGTGGASGRLEAEGDVDVFQFTVDEDTNVTISSFARFDAGVSVTLADAGGNAITLDDAGSADVTAGTYYLVVEAADGVSTGRYGVGVELPPPDDHVDTVGDDATVIETRDFRGTAYGRGFGELGTAGDVDVFQFNVESDTTVEVGSRAWVEGGVDVTLLDANGDAVALDDAGSAAVSAGTYFLSVAATDGASTGWYRVSIEIDLGPPADDHVDSIGDDATVVELREWRDYLIGRAGGNIGEAGDVDVFQFTLDADTTMNFRLRDSFSMTLSDGTNDIVLGEDGTALTAGTYYISIAAAEADATGYYRLRMWGTASDGGGESASMIAFQMTDDFLPIR